MSTKTAEAPETKDSKEAKPTKETPIPFDAKAFSTETKETLDKIKPKVSKNAFNLSRDATLVRLSISVFTGSVRDKELAEDTASRKGAAEDRIGVMLYRLRKEDRMSYQEIATAARNWLDKQGGSWDKDGNRLIPNVRLEEIKAKLEEFKDKFERAVKVNLLDRYDEIVAEAKKELTPQIFERVGFPDRHEIKKKCKFDIVYGAFPDPSDLRMSGVSDTTRKQLEDEIRQSQTEQLQDVSKANIERMLKALRDVAERMPKFDKREIIRFEDSLFTHLLSICEIMPSMNFTNDPTLAEVIAKTHAMFTKLTTNPEAMKALRQRDDADKDGQGAALRKEVTKTTKSLLSQLLDGAVTKDLKVKGAAK